MSTALAASLSEEDLQRQVVTLAEMMGWMVYHTYDSRRSQAGFPDLVCVKEGCEPLFIELKSENGKFSKDQKLWAKALGRLYYSFRPSDWFAGEIDVLLRLGAEPP